MTAAKELREQVQRVYGRVAEAPADEHPFRVGRELALRAGYPEEWLSSVPPGCVESFAGVSCLPCLAEFSSNSRILDLGCGAGLDSVLIAPRAGFVMGLDFSPPMVARAGSTAQMMGLTNIQFRVGDAESIDAETGSFDAAIVNGIFNLNPARGELFRELARVIRPGGVAFAAELVLKGPLPPEVKPSTDDWFA